MAAPEAETTTGDTLDYVAYAKTSKVSAGSLGSRLAYHHEGTGPAILFLHGFPTWSWDWNHVLANMHGTRQTIIPDLLGFGLSDKPVKEYTVSEQADLVEQLLNELRIKSLTIVAHDYGTIVLQEMLVRYLQGTLAFQIEKVSLLNAGIVYEAYRPTTLQVALRRPVVGHLLNMLISKRRAHKGLSRIFGQEHPLTDVEFEGLWYGISANKGQYLARRLLKYNDERKQKHKAWEGALKAFSGPMQLIWGTGDPVSGAHVLQAARVQLPNAEVVELQGLGHYPQVEDPVAVASALDRFLPQEKQQEIK